MNTLNWFLAPLFIHVALTNYVGIRNVSNRISSVMKGETKLSDIALNSANWPPYVKKWSNNFDNQFDVPTVWYVLTALIVATSKIDLVFIILSWIFVASRLLHTYIHTGSNFVRHRMYSFLVGFAALTIMWLWFGCRLLLAV